jgi:hypothetical protein
MASVNGSRWAALEQFLARPWVVVVAFGLNGAAMAALMAFERQFTALTGERVLDTQNGLTAPQLLEQLALYKGEALAAYQRFAAFDFVFPTVAGLALVSLWAALQQQAHPALQALRARKAWLLPLAATVFDYGENLAAQALLAAPSLGGAEVVIAFKRLKLGSLALIALGSVTLLAFNLGLWAWRRARAR